MTRITLDDINFRVEAYNNHQRKSKLSFSRRNGYCALDLCNKHGGVIRTVKTGTMREVYTYLCGILFGLLHESE